MKTDAIHMSLSNPNSLLVKVRPGLNGDARLMAALFLRRPRKRLWTVA